MALSREKDIIPFVPQLLCGISKIPQSGMRGYFPIMMRALARWKLDYETPGLANRIGLDKTDIKCLAGMFENLLLYDGTIASMPLPPAYISKNGFPNLNALNAAKLAAAKITRGALGEDGALALFIGARDGNAEVADFCNDAIKRLGINLEDANLVRGLYSLYFSDPRLNIQIGVLETLGRSRLAANTMPEMLELLRKGFEGTFPSRCLAYLRWFTPKAPACACWICAVGYENGNGCYCLTDHTTSSYLRRLSPRAAQHSY